MRLVLTLEDGTKGADYFSSLEDAGFSPKEILTLRSADPTPADFDGLLLSGGGDVDPSLYGQSPRSGLKSVNLCRDEQELALIGRAREIEVPVFGICRGLQVLNVAYGGTLIQDIPAETSSTVKHDFSGARASRAHTISTVPGGFLELDGPEFEVNSRHHQAIDRLGAGLAAAAYSPDRLVEAVEAESGASPKPVFAVQWHPENLRSDPRARRLFGLFYESVSRQSRERANRRIG